LNSSTKKASFNLPNDESDPHKKSIEFKNEENKQNNPNNDRDFITNKIP
jgi:hypothetical protein